MTKDGVKHVKDRHVGNKDGWDHKSKWTQDNAEWKNTSRDTFRNPDKITQTGDRFIYEKAYKNPIGVTPEGTPLYKSRVVLESSGDLVTSFPQEEFRTPNSSDVILKCK